jgi:hypothetical protein
LKAQTIAKRFPATEAGRQPTKNESRSEREGEGRQGKIKGERMGIHPSKEPDERVAVVNNASKRKRHMPYITCYIH